MYLILEDNTNISKQKEGLYLKAFSYYLSIDNRKLTDKYYSLCKALNSPDIVKTADISYDTFCNKDCKYLDETLTRYKSKPNVFSLEYLLSQVYANKGGIEHSSYFQSLADEHIKNQNQQNKLITQTISLPS